MFAYSSLHLSELNWLPSHLSKGRPASTVTINRNLLDDTSTRLLQFFQSRPEGCIFLFFYISLNQSTQLLSQLKAFKEAIFVRERDREKLADKSGHKISEHIFQIVARQLLPYCTNYIYRCKIFRGYIQNEKCFVMSWVLSLPGGVLSSSHSSMLKVMYATHWNKGREKKLRPPNVI